MYAMKNNARMIFVFSAMALTILAVSLTLSRDRFTWILEVFPILLALPVLLITYSRFPLTRFLYALLIIHFIILSVGGIYTYEKVPLGYWMQDWFGFARNHYDRIGHFAQGFIPALISREILLRTSPLRPGKWLSVIIVALCLAISALYELIEWRVSVAKGASAEAFLGTQGDAWDAQWDMCMALIGATAAVILFSKIHDYFIKKDLRV
jgi:putative membrane protein